MSERMNIKFNEANSVIINGVEYVPKSWVTDQALSNERAATGIEEPYPGEYMYQFNSSGIIAQVAYTSEIEERLYHRGMLTHDEKLLTDRDRALCIRFALEKYAAEHNTAPINWADENSRKYYIIYNTECKDLFIERTWNSKQDTVCFDSEQKALDAIKAIGEEDVLWLYRDYQPYLNAYET